MISLVEMVLLDLKKGVAGGNTPPKVYLVALERLCRVRHGETSMHYKKYTPCLGINRGSSLFIGISYGADPNI